MLFISIVNVLMLLTFEYLLYSEIIRGLQTFIEQSIASQNLELIAAKESWALEGLD